LGDRVVERKGIPGNKPEGFELLEERGETMMGGI